MNRRFAGIALVLLAAALPGSAAVDCRPPQNDELLKEYLQRFDVCSQQAEGPREEALKNEVADKTQKTLEAKPTATPGFASQIRDSIEDFLPLFSFAVDEITTSKDDRSLTLRFNPIRSMRWGSLAATLTATQPEPGMTLLAQVAEDQQAKLKELANQDLGDLGNLDFAVKWGFEHEATLDDTWLLGRSYKKYAPIIEDRLLPGIARRNLLGGDRAEIEARIAGCEERFDQPAAHRTLRRLGVTFDEPVQPRDLPISALEAVLGDEGFGSCLTAWQARILNVEAADARLDKLALLPYLIDNQPQLVFEGAWHERDALVGRDGWDAKVAYEMGFHNFNTLLDAYHKRRSEASSSDEEALVTAFWHVVDDLDAKAIDAIEAENRLTFSLAYGERNRYQLDQTFGEGDEAIPVSFDLDKATEWCGKLEWQRNATKQPIRIGDVVVHPRFHLSWEYIDVSDDPMRQDRMVAIATYEIPVPEGTWVPWPAGTSIPLSLSYANHSEFLGEPDEQLSAHFGISYKLPTTKD